MTIYFSALSSAAVTSQIPLEAFKKGMVTPPSSLPSVSDNDITLYLNRHDLATVIHALVTFQLPYCNVLFAYYSECSNDTCCFRQFAILNWLQRMYHSNSERISLAVCFQVQFNTLVVSFKALKDNNKLLWNFSKDRKERHKNQLFFI